MTELHYQSLIEVSRRIRHGEISSYEVTEALLQRIESRQDEAYVTVAGDLALQSAKEADDEIRSGRVRGLLHGVPIGLKDLCATPGVPTHVGGFANSNWNSSGEATVAARLREAGSVLLGKLKTTEGAYAVHHPDVLAPQNPWGANAWPGVSSSGSGVGTAAGLCFASLGTDTGGSIRFPSYANGIVGLKPTWGRVSRFGVFALADSLDHIGPMCRTVEDCAAVLEVIAGLDPSDPTSLPAPVPNYVAELERGVRGLRVGFDEEHCTRDMDPRVSALIFSAVEVLRDHGAEIVPVKVPDGREATASWGILCAVEAAIAHDGVFPEKRDVYGPVLADLLDAGRAATAMEYVAAEGLRAKFSGAFASMMEGIDCIVSPSYYTPNPTNAELQAMIDNNEVGKLIEHTAPADLSGSPALCLPGGFDDSGVPFGFQLVGAHLSEDRLLRAGYAIQEANDWKDRHPA